MGAPLQSFPASLLTLSPRETRVGDPSASVAGVNTTLLADGCVLYCIENKGVYRLDRTSTATPDGNLVIAPVAGPGRWLLQGSGSGAVIASYESRSVEVTTVTSTTDTALPIANAGAAMGFDLLPWTNGARLLLWCSVTAMQDDGETGFEMLTFTPRIELTSGNVVLAPFGAIVNPGVYGSGSGCYRSAPLSTEALMQVRVDWRTRFGNTGVLAPNDATLPTSFGMIATQVAP